MDKQALYDHILHLENQVGELYKELGTIRQHIVQLLEENHGLQVENHHLRKRLENHIISPEIAVTEEKEETKETNDKKQQVGEGYDNLARLYQEGFHICNVHYGSMRSEGDDCLFCLSFLKK